MPLLFPFIRTPLPFTVAAFVPARTELPSRARAFGRSQTPKGGVCASRRKTKMQALVAVMRKLLHAVYCMIRHQLPFEGSKVYRLPQGTVANTVSCTKEVA
jgi:hypothetical protein